LCFLSDDLIFDIKLFFKIDDFLTEDMGAICLSEQQAVDSKVPMLTGNIKLTPYTGQSRFGYGVVFFMHKKQWIDVPYELLVFYGDNFIFDQTYYRGLQNYMIDDLFHYHAGAQTSGFITENGKKDDQYINKECEAYFTKIQPKLINRELS
jgi:hypothetical protein